jgi:hypothetical protein
MPRRGPSGPVTLATAGRPCQRAAPAGSRLTWDSHPATVQPTCSNCTATCGRPSPQTRKIKCSRSSRHKRILPAPPSRPVSAVFAQSYRFEQTRHGNPIRGLANRVQGRRVMGQRQISPQPPHRGDRKATPCDSPHSDPSEAALRPAAGARSGLPARTATALPRPRGPPILLGERILPKDQGRMVAATGPGHATRRPTLLA